jgi:hypothetical protein
MRPIEARSTLAELQALRWRVRRQLAAFWMPVSVAGGCFLAVGLVSLVRSALFGPGVLLACATVTVVSTGFLRRRGRRVGLVRHRWPFLIIGVVYSIGCFVLHLVVATRPEDAGPWLLVAVGYLAFAWLERSLALIATAVAFAVIALVALAILPDLPLGATTAAAGIVAVTAGLLMRNAGRA